MITALTLNNAERLKKAQAVLSVIWSCVALGGFSALCVATIYWYFEPQDSRTIWHEVANISVLPGANAAVPMAAPPTGNKVVYKVQLVDAAGTVKYDYPSITVANNDYSQLGKMQLKLPATIKPGLYSMSAEMTYMMNPLKTNTVKLELAKVKVAAPSLKGESNASGFN